MPSTHPAYRIGAVGSTRESLAITGQFVAFPVVSAAAERREARGDAEVAAGDPRRGLAGGANDVPRVTRPEDAFVHPEAAHGLVEEAFSDGFERFFDALLLCMRDIDAVDLADDFERRVQLKTVGCDTFWTCWSTASIRRMIRDASARHTFT